ncbi:MAG TPA: adenylate/guanylate cyclase domain-containing protein [Thermoanaerobaculia bacterium]|nr:adenylate/guanylate cyclase domain-containing protein [Thermoanaerobaculia bacterium]HUM30857.1 adenylate/guanylate cyclase domain-containing protein [Thermoanaerobaculia bacterium]HXK69242.1 adenylate/guanylate cyclase domain-containing protein [Thermoanaerobaculia bacterium]
MNIAEFLPQVVSKYDTHTPWMKWVQGSVLFADVSGFTPMSEALSSLGVEGAEILTDILNRYFEEMITLIHDHGGQVMKFGGDAILCFFPGSRTLCRCARVAHMMQEKMGRFQGIKTPVKKFDLKMKIGIASGDVLLAGVGNPEIRCDYVFAGAPVDLTSDAEHLATAGDIVVSVPESGTLPPAISIESLSTGFARILEVTGSSQNSAKYFIPFAKPDRVLPYLIPEVGQMVKQGFQRYVGALLKIVPVFMKFSGFTYTREAFDLAHFHEFFTTIMEITRRYEGRLNRISMGDKGSTCFLLFGAPHALEKAEQMACQWALEVKDTMRVRFPDIGFGVGMNSGQVFAGIVGGGGRWEYTVMGDAVNFAARLMQGAESGQVCLSRELQEKSGDRYAARSLGKRNFKGKQDPLEVFELTERRLTRRGAKSKTELIGRREELDLLIRHLVSAKEKDPSMVLLEGPPGSGKTFLVAQFLNQARWEGWKVVQGRAEITTQSHAYSIWKEILSALFWKGRKPDRNDLIHLLSSVDEHYVDSLSWHEDFWGLKSSEGNAGVADETRKNLFHHQLCQCLLHMCTDRPTILFLDDLHWFDTLSHDLLVALLNHFRNQRICLIVTTREGWDPEELKGRASLEEVPIADLDQVDMKLLLESRLKGKVRKDLVEFIFERTGGNPFFTQQLIDYLKKNQMLESRMGEWAIRRGAKLEDSLTGSDIVISQLRQLPMPEQIHLRMASCMGPTFQREVLRKSLGRTFQAPVLHNLISLGYFHPVGEEGMAFAHTLVQETVYHAIPAKVRRQNHRVIGGSIEKILGSEDEEIVPNLANHFILADAKKRAFPYARRAAETLFRQMSFPESRKYYSFCYQYRKHTRKPEKWAIAGRLIETTILSGDFKKASNLVDGILRNVRRSSEHEQWPLFYLQKIEVLQKMGNYACTSRIQRILTLDQKVVRRIAPKLHYFLGVAEYRRGRFDRALPSFTIAAGDIEANCESKVPLTVFTYMAHIAIHRGEVKKAFDCIDEGEKLAIKRCFVYEYLKLENARAAMLLDSGKHLEAKEIYTRLFNEAESFGDYYLLATILLNLGNIEIDMQNYEQAFRHLEEALLHFINYGVRNGEAECYNLMGITQYYLGNFQSAYDYYLQSNAIYEDTGEMERACYGYYNLAEVSIELHDVENARMWYEKGMSSFNERDHTALASLYSNLHPMLKQKERPS